MMKKTLIGLTALALVLLGAAGAVAKKPAPPKNLCLQLASPLDYVKFSLALKMAGTINTLSGPVKFYTISGEHFWTEGGTTYSVPVTGTGHVNGTKLHFTLTGSAKIGSIMWTFDSAVQDYDLVTHTGTLYRRFITDATPGLTGIFSLQDADCTASVIPFDAQSGEGFYFPGQYMGTKGE
jgi:hypothetical protein